MLLICSSAKYCKERQHFFGFGIVLKTCYVSHTHTLMPTALRSILTYSVRHIKILTSFILNKIIVLFLFSSLPHQLIFVSHQQVPYQHPTFSSQSLSLERENVFVLLLNFQKSCFQVSHRGMFTVHYIHPIQLSVSYYFMFYFIIRYLFFLKQKTYAFLSMPIKKWNKIISHKRYLFKKLNFCNKK